MLLKKGLVGMDSLRQQRAKLQQQIVKFVDQHDDYLKEKLRPSCF